VTLSMMAQFGLLLASRFFSADQEPRHFFDWPLGGESPMANQRRGFRL
jgi:hypothetical protein